MPLYSKKDFDKDVFPYTEDDTLEFKENFNEMSFTKYIQTICGFLNGSGGNIIFGIRDNGKNVGLQYDRKMLDKCLLRIDTITTSYMIIGTDKDSNVHNLTNNILPRIVTNSNKKNFIVVSVSKNTDVGLTYQYKGEVVHRLGASNYCAKAQSYYTEISVRDQQKKICKDYETIIERMQLDMTNAIIAMNNEKKNVEEYLSITDHLIAQSIQRVKPTSYYSDFLSSLTSCFLCSIY